jgi:uncharacterized membrane protein
LISRVAEFAKRNRYHFAILFLLGFASFVCATLLAARIAVTDSRRYIFLAWNLYLAWIPVVFAYIALAFSKRRYLLYGIVPLFAFLWLIFFPNAPYILTDLQHLALELTDVPVWYDVILLIWFSWTGVLLGVVSLYIMHMIVSGAFGRWMGWAFVLIVSALSSLGIYLGRFGRFNSWDIFQHPSEVALTILGRVIDPSLRLVAFTGSLTAFFLFVYLTLYAFGHLLNDGSSKPSGSAHLDSTNAED